MRKVKAISTHFSLVTFILFCFQNCGVSHDPVSDNILLSSELSLEQKAVIVVERHCASCHGGTNNQGGISQIENMAHNISTGLIVPGQPDSSRFVGSVEEGRMPTSYRLDSLESGILRDYVLSLSAGPTVQLATCSVTVDKTTVQSGQSVAVTLNVQGQADSATLNGQVVAANGATINITPSASTTINGSVSNAAGNSNCTSPQITVTPPPQNAPTCSLASSAQGVVPGDNVTLTITVVSGSATSAMINGQSVTLNSGVGTATVAPIATTTYSGSVTGLSGTSSCSVQVTRKATANLTKTEYYRAKIGPNNQSIDDLAVRCIQCHTQNPPTAYIHAKDYFVLNAGDISGNLATLRNAPINLTTGARRDLTVLNNGSLNGTLHSFSQGHKPKNPPYTSAELTHIANFVNKP